MKLVPIAMALALGIYQQVIRVDVQLQQVTAVVRDGSGHFVPGLKAEDFILEDDGVRQDIARFEQESVSPISLGVFADTCWEPSYGSARAWIGEPPVPETGAVLGMIGPQDEATLMGCSDRLGNNSLKVYEDFTSDLRRLERHAKNAGGGVLDGGPRCCRVGMTRFEVIATALEKMKKAKNRRRALVVITLHPEDWAATEIQELTSLLAKITPYEIPVYLFANEIPRQHLDRTLPIVQLAIGTGGSFLGYSPRFAAPQFATNLEADIRGQYSIGYYLKTPAPSSSRVIRARTKSPGQTVAVRRLIE